MVQEAWLNSMAALCPVSAPSLAGASVSGLDLGEGSPPAFWLLGSREGGPCRPLSRRGGVLGLGGGASLQALPCAHAWSTLFAKESGQFVVIENHLDPVLEK